MKFCMVEPAMDEEMGSIGAFFIANQLRETGFTVDIIQPNATKDDYDVELVSVHHPEDYERLRVMPKHGKIRIGGGHVTYNNPRPIIPLVDVLCLGDGEGWIESTAKVLQDNFSATALQNIPGTIISEFWECGKPLPPRNYEKPLPPNPPYLNRPATRSAAWYIEVARGCPFRCHYCELGHSMAFRYRKKEEVFAMLEGLDQSKAKKIVFFAPDEASTPWYDLYLAKAKELGLRQAFGSYRLDKIIKKGGMPVDNNQLVRVGIDGLTQETRFKVEKKITDRQIVDYFRVMINQGHVNFKIFQMFAHPWERPKEDFRQWERVMSAIFNIPLKKNVSLRIKWTPLIPQPVTPLENVKAIYNPETVYLIKAWHKKVRRPKNTPGWYVENDGLMSARSHAKQIVLTHGDELSLIDGAAYVSPAWRRNNGT